MSDPEIKLNPCGGGSEYFHPSPASRRRRWKGKPVPGGITGQPCPWGTSIQRPGPPGWAWTQGWRTSSVKKIIAKSKKVKIGYSVAEYFKESYGSERVVLSMMMTTTTKKKKKKSNLMRTEIVTQNTIINLCNFFASPWIKWTILASASVCDIATAKPTLEYHITKGTSNNKTQRETFQLEAMYSSRSAR
jgi:hypothetical protein